MNAKHVWVIERGSYSDYGVVGVYSSLENAQIVHAALKEAGTDELHDIECWTLDPAADEIKKGYQPFLVLMLRNGDVERCEQRERAAYYIPTDENITIWERTKAPAYKDKNVPDVLSATVWAKDAKHAIKIVNEHRAKMIANGEWK